VDGERTQIGAQLRAGLIVHVFAGDSTSGFGATILGINSHHHYLTVLQGPAKPTSLVADRHFEFGQQLVYLA
jgi:hypothetical protein